ncbi:uncharacterized protein LOC134183589 [Corticium candelabrum]|uniref:uncharacterized protein LOC134183589 n=1 Tax=Corticium candelabrum TaxID=121492 RepID=UPI002E2682C8|nr:uncharacterized protein LOC134183589 [Corticium candelabrum]
MGRFRLLAVKEVQPKTFSFSSDARRTFRQVSRNASGASLEPLEGEVVFFGCDVEGTVVSVASLLLDHPKPEMWDEDEQSVNDICSEDWDAETCTTVAEWDCCSANKLSFLFVLPRHQRRGYGRQLMDFVESYAWARSDRPIKLESSRRGLDFFTQLGYIPVGDPIHCAHPSSSLFKTLQRMIKMRKRRLN